MKIHQAFFGDKNGSHNLIASSIENKSVIGHLKLNTDIPASISILKGYLSGFRIDEYYVLTKTINDTESERPGMGFSHCLIIPIDELKLIDNLQDIIGLFVNEPVKQPSQLSDLELITTQFNTSLNSVNYEEMIFQLSENKGTVVYLGYDHFENDLVKAWSVMSPKLRANLAFTISGSPNEIENEQITIVHTPESYEPRWSKFPMVKNKSIDPKNRESIKFLIEPAAKESIEFYEFVNVNAISFEYFHQYPAIAKLFRLSKKAIAAPETMLLKRVITSITEIIPLPENGAELKKTILDLFIKSIELTEGKGVLLLRNMVFTSFANGESRILQLMNSWADKFISPERTTFFPEGIKIMQEAYLPINPEWWKQKIADRFDKVCQKIDEVTAVFIWTLWTAAPELIQHTKIATENEEVLYTQRKHVKNNTFYRELTTYSIGKKWYSMHAESISYELSPGDAIRAQLRFDKSKVLEKHLDIIRINITDPVFFKECTTLDDKIIHEMGGKILNGTPGLFGEINISNLNWQKIWYESYLISGHITVAGQSITKTFLGLIELVLQKKEYSKPLLKAIASNTGNLYDHENRAKIWSLLDSDTCLISLDKTCPHIIGNFKPEDWPSFEVEIKQHITRPEFIKKEIISNKKIGIGTKITILETIGKMTGESLIDIVTASNNTINHLEAETLTNIINKHSLKNVLEYFYGNRGRYHLFPEVVDGCKHLLSGWERLWLKSSVNPVSIQSIYHEIDRQNLHYVFGILRDLGFNDHHINRLQNEYVAGVKGIELQDLCDRLKSYVQSHS